MFTKLFWIRSAERAIKTFAQALLTLVGADQVAGFFDASFREVILSALFATFLSFLTSLASTLKDDSQSPSLVDSKIEEAVLEKVAAGEPVGDPERVVAVTGELPVGVDDAVGVLDTEVR